MRRWVAQPMRDGTDEEVAFDVMMLVYPLDSQAHIFDTFYTTKPAGVGTGLGLGIVHRIVEQYGGSIRFSSVPGTTEFIVRLPSVR